MSREAYEVSLRRAEGYEIVDKIANNELDLLDPAEGEERA
jgi:hypothetical protein